MSVNYLTNVLNILRLLANTAPTNTAAIVGHLMTWTATTDENSPQILKMVAYIQEQCEGALALVNSLEIPEEDKAGPIQTITHLRGAFNFAMMGSAIGQSIPHLAASLSGFRMFVLAFESDVLISDNPEIRAIIAEIVELQGELGSSGIDRFVRETAQRHLHILHSLLVNVDALGVDSAMAAYFEMVVRIQKAEKMADDTSRETMKGFWPFMRKWGDRLKSVDDAASVGVKLVGYGAIFQQAIGFAV